jgi:penicillin-binding protein 1A
MGRGKSQTDGTTWNIYKDGLKIYTTINYKMQTYAEEAVDEWIKKNLQPQFFKHWAGHKNAPFYNISADETEAIMVRAMKNSSRYKELKRDGYSEKEIRKIFETPTRMWLFTHQGEVDTILSLGIPYVI